MAAHPAAVADVLVIGGGPAGSATALTLARRGHRVLVVERDDGRSTDRWGLLTPRALAALDRLEVAVPPTAHRVEHVRLTAMHSSTTTSWPRHPAVPAHALVADRDALDHALLRAAIDAGATVLGAHDALAPIVDRGFVRGADVRSPDGTRFEARATYTVVADGANSQFGRALGTHREPRWPYALAHHGRFASPLAAAGEIELVLDLRDRAGTPITGFGWMFPTGGDTVVVGVLMMSTSASFQVINPAHLWERFAADQRPRWQLGGEVDGQHSGGRITLGNSVGPAAGPTYLLVGDAVGAANPMSGAGIDGALETGTIAGDVLDEALNEGASTALQSYPRRLAERYGTYHHVGRLATRLFGNPTIAQRGATLVTHRETAASGFVRIATDALRSHRVAAPELVYRAARAITKVAPDA